MIVNSRKYDGSVRRSWTCDLIERSDSLLVFLGEFDEDVRHPDLGLISRGTLSYEYYWLNRWYNIFRFHEPGGEFRNYYCNLNMPPTFDGEVLDYVDLDIDVLVERDLSYRVLDLEDYEANARKFGYPSEIRANVDAALRELLELIERRKLPGFSELFATSSDDLRESE